MEGKQGKRSRGREEEKGKTHGSSHPILIPHPIPKHKPNSLLIPKRNVIPLLHLVQRGVAYVLESYRMTSGEAGESMR